MKNITVFFAIDNKTGKLVRLGVGENTVETANLLANLYESVAASTGNHVELVGPVLNIEDLYRLIGEAQAALNTLPLVEMEAAKEHAEEE